MFDLRFLLLLSAAIYNTEPACLPMYYSKCCVGPTLNACLMKQANNAFSAALQGDAHYNVPSFSPLRLPKIVVLDGPRGHFFLDSPRVYGFQQVTVTKFSLDFAALAFDGQYEFPSVRIESVYRMNLTGTPAVGFGHATIKIRNAVVNHTISVQVDDQGYARVMTSRVNYLAESVKYWMSNMQSAGNSYLNQNAQEMHDLFAPLLSVTISDVCSWPYKSISDMVKMVDGLAFNCPPNITSVS